MRHWLLLALLLVHPIQSGGAQPAPTQASDVFTVLLIDAYQPNRPLWQEFYSALTADLSRVNGRRVVFFQENLDYRHLADPGVLDRSMEWYAERYRSRQIDLIFTQGSGPLRVGLALRTKLGRDIPVVRLLSDPERPETAAAVPRIPGTAAILVGQVDRSAVGFMLAARPEVREVALIVDSPREAEALVPRVRSALPSPVRLTVLSRPTLASLQRDLNRLDSTAVVYFHNLMIDGDDQPWVPADFVAAFAPTSPRPVFTSLRTLVGLGPVGGTVVEPRALAKVVADVGAAILGGAHPDSLATVTFTQWPVVVDWEQVQRHGITRSALPEDATILNRPLAPWQAYPRTSAAVSLLIGLLLASTIIAQRSQRLLRQARDARSELSQRLMQLQEEERTRIARDLHDDLCQRMTALAIELDRATGSATPHASPSPGDRVRGLIQRTQDIARDLHSTWLGMMELPQAVAELVASLRGGTDLPITVDAETWPRQLPPELTTAAYRVVQEALQNVIRHAGASQCSVSLTRRGRSLQVAIRDDGVGFRENTTAPRRLGLLSMRERAEGMGGTLHIESAPYEGTTIILSLPLPEDR